MNFHVKDSGDVEKNHKEHLNDVVNIDNVMDVDFSDIVGLDSIKDLLRECVVLPIKYPELFAGRNLFKTFLLFGAPGTGKTMITKALVGEVNKIMEPGISLMSFSIINLMREWHYSASEFFVTLLDVAIEMAPVVIHIDDIDDLCRRPSLLIRQFKTEFLIFIHNLPAAGIYIFGETSVPWQIDASVRKRFVRRLMFPLPNVKERITLFNMNMKNVTNNLTEDEFQQIATETNGLTPADIFMLCRDASMEQVRICFSSTHWKQVTGKTPKGEERDDMLTPCSPQDPQVIEMILTDIEDGDRLLPPLIGIQDFSKLLSTFPSFISERELNDIEQFNKDFGPEA
ncbi:hypothetical protein PCE1_001910 [Barthelona sp. PCE]